MRARGRASEVQAWKVSDLLDRWATHGEAGLPLTIAEAYQAGHLDFPSPLIGDTGPDRIDVITHVGITQASHGWWLVLGPEGLRPCSPEVFCSDYEVVEP